MKPIVSLILPVYKTEKYIRRCLDSIIKQTFKDFEVIIVNDASPDNAINLIMEYAQQDDRFRIIQKEKNEGSMAARKSGYTVAKGDYFVFCDSDDYLEPQALEILYKVIKENDADIAISGYKYLDEDNNPIYEKVYKLPFGSSSLNVYKALLTDTIPHMLWGNIYTRKLFDNYTYSCFLNQTNGEDMILFYELIQHTKKVVTTDCSLYFYCRNKMSATQTRYSLEQLKKIIFVGNYWLKFMEEKKIYPKLVHKKAWKSMYSKLISGYDRYTIIKGNEVLMNYFSFHELVNSMGLLRGIDLFLFCRSKVYSKCRILIKK